MNSIEELITKWEQEFAKSNEILNDIDMNLFPNMYSNEYIKKKQIQFFIEDLKNLPNELRAVNRNEHTEEFCAKYKDNLFTGDLSNWHTNKD